MTLLRTAEQIRADIAAAGGEAGGRKTPQPRPQQVAALTALARAVPGHDRVQLVMACGTGKTLVGRWHAQAVDAAQVVVFAPSLALVAQLLAEWRRAEGWPFEALVVCSDPTTAAGVDERRTDDGSDADVAAPVWATVRAKVTTSPAVAAQFLRGRKPGRPQVIVSTYHSAPVVAAAQRLAGTVFDLAVCDEAHRLAGRPRAEFRTVLDDQAVRTRSRVFMTATPQSFPAGDGVVSMDDEALFGPVAHKVSFREAIDAGVLADYQVLVVAYEQRLDAWRPAAAPGALLEAVDRYGIRRMLTYHGRVAKARDFAAMFDVTHTPGRTFIRARHVTGSHAASARAETLRWLGDGEPGQAKVVASARCLTEGIDVPAVDAVMFADPRKSIVDIVQSVGRVLRPSPGKDRGSIIIPVALPPGTDDDTELSVSEFAAVWAVLRGLREHDELLARELDEDAAETAAGRHPHRRSGHVQFMLPHELEQPIRLRLVQEFGTGWDRFHAATMAWARANPGARIAALTTHAGVGIGHWAAKQRTAYRQGTLSAEHAARLEQIPGWWWDRAEADWDDTFTILEQAVTAYGTAEDRLTAPSRYAGLYAHNGSMGPYRLGIWLALQRQAYRDGMLDPGKAARLESLPGWDWAAGLRDVDVRMVQALKLFGDFEKHANVPDDYIEDGQPLGRWVWAVRRAHYLGQVPPALVDELEAASPRDSKGMSMWRWEQVEAEWRWKYNIVRRYCEEHGRPPAGTWREVVDDRDANVGQWCAQQRFRYRRGLVDEQHTAWLEALPGWQWALQGRTLPDGEPIDLGGHPHGTAKGSQAKCPCGPCRQYSRDRGREALARKRQLVDPVPADAADRHLARLEAAGAKRTAIAVAAGVPLGVVRQLAAGAEQIERGHRDALLAVTVDACLEVGANKVGSRGRLTSTRHERIPVGPTRELLDGLAVRGFTNGWVSRELGYGRGGLQVTGKTITRRVADAVAELAARIPPELTAHVRGNQLAPPLSVLMAGLRQAS